MKKTNRILVQIQSIQSTIMLILAVSAILLGLVLMLHFQTGVSIAKLTRDPVSALDGSPYIGFLSQVGIFFWAGSAVICLFTAHILANCPSIYQLKNFFLISGFLSLFLGLDDVFCIHEVLSSYHVGIPEKIIFASYAGFILFWLVKFSPIILRSEYLLLGMALAFFGLSIILDVMRFKIAGISLVEDGAKLIGILSWQAYFFRIGAFAICHNPKTDRHDPH